MSGAVITMAFAAVQAELAYRRGRCGDQAGERRHGGWAVIVGAISLFNAMSRWVFG
jgi:hypothetical protein